MWIGFTCDGCLWVNCVYWVQKCCASFALVSQFIAILQQFYKAGLATVRSYREILMIILSNELIITKLLFDTQNQKHRSAAR